MSNRVRAPGALRYEALLRHNRVFMRAADFEKRASGRTLLLVEDDADIREALSGLLAMEGFLVIGLPNGREALDWLRKSPRPELILLDLMMPVMDGWQFRVAQKEDP
jgi:CheY-like chemotaxis protein